MDLGGEAEDTHNDMRAAFNSLHPPKVVNCVIFRPPHSGLRPKALFVVHIHVRDSGFALEQSKAIKVTIILAEDVHMPIFWEENE